MAALSYYLIENPIRRNQLLLSLPKQVVSGALTVMVLICATMYGFKLHSETLYNDPEHLQFVAARQQTPVIYQYGCDEWFLSVEVRPCVFDMGASDKKAVLIGDSVLAQWFPAIAEYLLERKWQLVVLTKSSCPMVNRSFFYDRIKSTYHVCDQWREQAIKEIVALNPQLVIMGGSSGYPFSKTDWQEGTREIFDQLLPYTGQVKLIAPAPGLGLDGPNCLARLARISALLPDVPQSSCSRKRRSDESWGWLSEVASEYPGVQTIELGEAVCPGGICSAKTGDTIVYRDHLHLTTDFVLTLKALLGEKLEPLHAGPFATFQHLH
jgi:hypothetical protein